MENEDILEKTKEATVYSALYNQAPNEELGITQEYNKANRDRLWDSTKSKNKYKEKVFGDKKTYYEPISGNVLHKNQNAAQRKYHMKNSQGENKSTKWTSHSAEVDHREPIKELHSIYKKNPFLKDSDLKNTVNKECNYQIISKHDNISKGAKSNFLAKNHINMNACAAKNVANEFMSGAQSTLAASAIPLTVEAVNTLCKVADGEKTIDEASKEIGKNVVDVATVGGCNVLLLDAINSPLKNCNNPLLSNISGAELGQIVAVAMVIKDTAVKYINGEIEEKEFLGEVVTRTTTMAVAATIGQIVGNSIAPGVGGVVGEVVATMITTIACSAITSFYNTYKGLDNYKLKESQIRRLESEALKEMENQRNKFRSLIEREYKHWDEEIQSGFDMMLSNACEATFNIQGVTEGLDRILAVFGKGVRFKSIEEYEAQLDMPLRLGF